MQSALRFPMLRSIVAVIVAVVTWFIVATVVNWILRAALPGYSVAERFVFTVQDGLISAA
jgi:hypothetical protein